MGYSLFLIRGCKLSFPQGMCDSATGEPHLSLPQLLLSNGFSPFPSCVFLYQLCSWSCVISTACSHEMQECVSGEGTGCNLLLPFTYPNLQHSLGDHRARRQLLFLLEFQNAWGWNYCQAVLGLQGNAIPRLEKKVPRALVKSKGLLIILTASSFIHVALQGVMVRLQPGTSVKSAWGMFFLPVAVLSSSGWRCTG